MSKIITALYDNVAKEIIGALPLHRHEQAAVRMFADAMKMEQFKTHVADFTLLRLGTVEDDNATITSEEPTELISGTTLLAALSKGASE